MSATLKFIDQGSRWRIWEIFIWYTILRPVLPWLNWIDCKNSSDLAWNCYQTISWLVRPHETCKDWQYWSMFSEENYFQDEMTCRHKHCKAPQEFMNGNSSNKVAACAANNTVEEELVYEKLPSDIANRHVLMMDPMLGTGNSASRAIQVRRIHLLVLSWITIIDDRFTDKIDSSGQREAIVLGASIVFGRQHTPCFKDDTIHSDTFWILPYLSKPQQKYDYLFLKIWQMSVKASW